MLERLYVENIALIDRLEVAFGQGLNVLSGETGAGKSILIDSLNLALGERADRELISSGSTRALVHAFFDIDGNEKVLDALEQYGIDREERLMLTRELSADGKNTCRINGRPVSLNILREITCHLVDIYGQHEHQTLLDSENHLAFLDNYAGKELLDLLKKINKKIIIVSKNIDQILKKKYESQYKNILFISNDSFHDRFIILDRSRLYSCGASFKDLGKKCFAINKFNDKRYLNEILNILDL